ncbi:MAG: hypothetical protein VX899_12085 [Myxococcota bacterium]|nr:hypothetical protein [Myxococcota bacterium]
MFKSKHKAKPKNLGGAVWQDFKDRFYRVQHGRCGYCDAVITGSDGDVEHYRPKAKVQELGKKGTESRDGVKVSGQTAKKSRSFVPGYWWLALTWTNYLFSCEVCNRKWKKNFFHIQGGRAGAPAQGSEAIETPLLMTCFDGPDPIHHLRFDDLGQVEPLNGSSYGRQTIDLVGLDRESLRAARQEKAFKAHQLSKRVLNRALLEDWSGVKESAQDLLDLGEETTTFAGVVRCIAAGHGLAWNKVTLLAR